MHGRREEVERLIYEFVNEYAEQNNVYPSYREIANTLCVFKENSSVTNGVSGCCLVRTKKMRDSSRTKLWS